MDKTQTISRKRVLLVQTQAEMAGAQEISRLLGEGLSAAGYEVHHLFLYRKTAGCNHFPNVHFVAREKPRGPLGALRFLRDLYREIRALRPDAVLTFQHYGNIVAAPFARLAGVRQVIANHVSAPATISGPVRLADRWLGLLGFYEIITVNSQQTWQDYQSYPARYKRRMVHVPHGFARRESTLSRAEARTKYKLPHNVPLAGSVARLHPLKRLDLALKILPRLPGLHFAIAGQGPHEDHLRGLASQLGVADRVHFVGEMRSEAIGDFLAALDLFVFPSAAETFGLAAVEAAQAGVPVVANDLPVLRETLAVDDAPCAVFVDAADTEEFACAVSHLLDDPAGARTLSERGRLLSRRYSPDAMVDAYRALIGEERSSVPERAGKYLADTTLPDRAG